MPRIELLLRADSVRAGQVAEVELGLAEGAVAIRLVALEVQLEEGGAAGAFLVQLAHAGHSVALTLQEQVETVQLAADSVESEALDLRAELARRLEGRGGALAFLLLDAEGLHDVGAAGSWVEHEEVVDVLVLKLHERARDGRIEVLLADPAEYRLHEAREQAQVLLLRHLFEQPRGGCVDFRCLL